MTSASDACCASLPLVVSVILNTSHRDDTLECLASLQRASYPNHRALVLDNASGDGSVDAIQAAFPAVTVVSLAENLGYAGNNNIGIEAAVSLGADWIFVLNEDTTLAPDCISQLVEVGRSDATIGILGPMVYHYDEPDIIQSAGGKISPSWDSFHIGQNTRDAAQFAGPHPVDWVSGCAITFAPLLASSSISSYEMSLSLRASGTMRGSAV